MNVFDAELALDDTDPPGYRSAYLRTAALLGGVIATWFEARELSLHVQWISPTRASGFVALQFAHWEFLFAIAFALATAVVIACTMKPASALRCWASGPSTVAESVANLASARFWPARIFRTWSV